MNTANNSKTTGSSTQQNDVLKDGERQRCEIWTRVMGYHRPVNYFNPGKRSEFSERVCFPEASFFVK
jgi:anaerobic ribonucleoside-triphosphate reductase